MDFDVNKGIVSRIKKIIPLFTMLWILLTGTALYSQDITVTGSWTLNITGADLQAGAGSDLNPTYTSDSNEIRIDINNTNSNWRVTVRGSVTNWNPNLQFGLRRTTGGGGPGWVSGGTAWIEVTGVDQQFFTGSRRRSNIRVQCGLTNVSLQIPPDVYSGTIIYTLTEI